MQHELGTGPALARFPPRAHPVVPSAGGRELPATRCCAVAGRAGAARGHPRLHEPHGRHAGRDPSAGQAAGVPHLMISYEGWGSPPPPRRRRSRLLLGLGGACLLLACAALAGLAFSRRTPPPPSPAAASASPAVKRPVTSPARQLSLGACIDDTTSLVSSFAPGIRSDLAQAVASLAPHGTLDTNAARAGQPVTVPQSGISLTIREVVTNSAASILTKYTRVVSVPGIPGLSTSRPDVRVPGYEHYLATRVLDAGAMGIVFPHVDSAEQAAKLVSFCKYPPVGHRSAAGA